MHLLAPLSLLLLASGALYNTKEIWPVEEYNIVSAQFGKSQMRLDRAQLALLVKKGEILEEQKSAIMESTWKDGKRLRSGPESARDLAHAKQVTSAKRMSSAL